MDLHPPPVDVQRTMASDDAMVPADGGIVAARVLVFWGTYPE